jgi:hypothetical protein
MNCAFIPQIDARDCNKKALESQLIEPKDIVHYIAVENW